MRIPVDPLAINLFFRKIAMTPSEQQCPLTLTSKDLHAPSGESMLSNKKSREVPPTITAVQLPDLIS